MSRKVRARNPVSSSVRGTTVAISTLVMVLLLSSLAAAGTVIPPYKGAVVFLSNSLSTSGCSATAHNVAKTSWSPITGTARMAESGSSRSCAKSLWGVGGLSSGMALGSFDLAIPVKVGAGGAHSVAAAWTFNWAGSDTLFVGGACPKVVLDPAGNGTQYCAAVGDGDIYGYSFLVDMTNGTTFYPTSYWLGVYNFSGQLNYTFCFSFSCSYFNSSLGTPGTFSGNSNHTWYFNQTLLGSHHYVLTTHIEASAAGSIQGYPRSHASGALNMSSLGKGAKLTGITIT